MAARCAEYKDLEGILELYKLLIPDDEKAEEARLMSLWEEIIGNPGRYRYLVAEEEGRILATCNIALVPNLSHGGRPFGIIENVITHPDARRKGFGRAVLEKALDFARETCCCKVMLLSGSHRTEAHAFYKSLGFDGDRKRGFCIYL